MKANKAHLTVDEFYPGWLVAREKGEACMLIDVRTPEEYADAHVPTSRLMPLHTLQDRADQIARDETVYLICQGGVRSKLAMKQLREQGMNNLVTIVGGTQAWIESGYPVERGNGFCDDPAKEMAEASREETLG